MNALVLFILVGFLILTGFAVLYFWVMPWRFIKHTRRRLATLEGLLSAVKNAKESLHIEDLNVQEVSQVEIENKIISTIEALENSSHEVKMSNFSEIIRSVYIVVLKVSLEDLSKEVSEYHKILEMNSQLAYLPIKLNMFSGKQHQELDKITDRLKGISIQLKNL